AHIKKASNSLARLLHIGTYTYSDFKKVIVWFDYDETVRSEFKASPCFNINVNELEVEQKVFLKDSFNRVGKKAYNLVVGKEPESIRIKLKDLGFGSNKEMDVYIQDHVFDRVCERLDAMDIIT